MPERSWRHYLQATLISTVVGAAVSSFFAVARWPDGFWTIIFIGAVIGFSISLCIALLHAVFDRVTSRLRPLPHLLVRCLLFLVGGTVGSVLGLVGGVRILGHAMKITDMFSGRGPSFIILSGIISVLVGLSMRAYELTRERLATTIEQLKEAEWAEKELELARSIQTRLLPPALIEDEHFTIAARNLPARFVAGDFYDIVRREDGSVLIAVADVAGKGIGASLIMASVKAVLPFVAREGVVQGMIMLNEKLVRELGKREFVALALARYVPHDRTLEIVNAGFPDPYVISDSGVRALVVEGPRLPLGLRSGIAYEPMRAQLAAGDRLLFVSDGIPEAPVRGEPLGYDRFVSIVASLNGNARGAEWLDALLSAIRASVDEGLEDDWTAVVLDVESPVQ